MSAKVQENSHFHQCRSRVAFRLSGNGRQRATGVAGNGRQHTKCEYTVHMSRCIMNATKADLLFNAMQSKEVQLGIQANSR